MIAILASLKGSFAMLGVGGFAALWVVKAVLGFMALRWWKARRAPRV